MADEFSHLNKKGEANMVDVGHKPDQERIAKASGKIFLQPKTLELIKTNSIEKGDIFSVATDCRNSGSKEHLQPDSIVSPITVNKNIGRFFNGARRNQNIFIGKMYRENRRGNGSVDGCKYCFINHLRHVQGSGQNNDNGRN